MAKYNIFRKFGVICLFVCSWFSFAAIQDSNELAKLLVEKGYITEQKDYKIYEEVPLLEILQMATYISKDKISAKYVCKWLVKGKKYPKWKKIKNCWIIENALKKWWIWKWITEKELESTLDTYKTLTILLKASGYPILPDTYQSYVRYGFSQDEADIMNTLMKYGLLRHMEYDLQYYYLGNHWSWPANRDFLFWYTLTFDSGVLFQREMLEDDTTRYMITFKDATQFVYRSSQSKSGAPEVVWFGRDKMYYRYYGSTMPDGNSSDYAFWFWWSIIEVDLKKKIAQESLTDYSETCISLDRALYVYKNIMYVVEWDKKTQYRLDRPDSKFTLFWYSFSPDNTKIAFIVRGNADEKTIDTAIILDKKMRKIKRFEVQYTGNALCTGPKWKDDMTPDIYWCNFYGVF